MEVTEEHSARCSSIGQSALANLGSFNPYPYT